VEFDHSPIPFAAGGESTVDNLELRCRAHNRYLADRFFARIPDDACRSRAREKSVPPMT
jgi:hypothetical protein